LPRAEATPRVGKPSAADFVPAAATSYGNSAQVPPPALDNANANHYRLI